MVLAASFLKYCSYFVLCSSLVSSSSFLLSSSWSLSRLLLRSLSFLISASLHQQLASHGTTLTKKAVSETVIHQRSRDEVTPPRSPLLVVESNKAAHLLLRPADNSPFTSTPATIHGLHHVSNQSNASTNSTPFSQISVPSSYEYEDDFTSESESEVSLLPAAMLPMPGLPTIPHHSYQLPNSTITGDKR